MQRFLAPFAADPRAAAEKVSDLSAPRQCCIRKGTIFASLTTVPQRSTMVRLIIESFERHEKPLVRGSTRALISFLGVVDQTDQLPASFGSLQLEHSWVSFVIKENIAEYGQPRSLNLILKRLHTSGAEFWLKWEDSWLVSRPFTSISLGLLQRKDIVEVHVCRLSLKQISRGQPAEERDGVRFFRRQLRERSARIKSRCDTLDVGPGLGYLSRYGEKQTEVWPNFSLRPGLIRAEPVLAVGPFDTQPLLWPYKFEVLWACRFFNMHPGTVDQFVLLEGGATLHRPKDYTSTYRSNNNTPAWLTEAEMSRRKGER